MRYYVALVHKDADSDFGVSFPDFPGCVSAGATLAEAAAMAAEALDGHIALMADEGHAIPEPSALDAILADPDNQTGTPVMVPAPARPARAIRLNITMPEDVLARVDAHAERQGMNRSGFLAYAAKREMDGIVQQPETAGKPDASDFRDVVAFMALVGLVPFVRKGQQSVSWCLGTVERALFYIDEQKGTIELALGSPHIPSLVNDNSFRANVVAELQQLGARTSGSRYPKFSLRVIDTEAKWQAFRRLIVRIVGQASLDMPAAVLS